MGQAPGKDGGLAGTQVPTLDRRWWRRWIDYPEPRGPGEGARREILRPAASDLGRDRAGNHDLRRRELKEVRAAGASEEDQRRRIDR